MIIIDDIEQGTEEWLAEKLGKPSASNASKIVDMKGNRSKQREGYLYELAAERLTGQRPETYKNEYMQMGNDREDESRQLFEMTNNVEVVQVGVVYKNDERRFLCSPDGLILTHNQGLELKNVLPKTQVKRLIKKTLPSEYFQQIQMSMFVTGFDYWHFVSYSPGLNPLLIECKRDNEFIKKLSVELHAFCDDLDQIVKELS